MTPTLFIDPFTGHFLEDRLFQEDWPGLGDHLLAPYAALKRWFEARGVHVRTADYLFGEPRQLGTQLYVSLGLQRSARALARVKHTIPSAFFAVECPIVEPTLYEDLPRIQESFRRLYCATDRETLLPFVKGPTKSQTFRLPQSRDSVHEKLWRHEDRSFLVMMSKNKRARLNVNELYSERLLAVESFGRTSDIDLYGSGWDRSTLRVGRSLVPATLRRLAERGQTVWQMLRPDPLLIAARRAYRGRAESKSETLGRYTFSLCYENVVLKGWITEKIFDCFFAGTIPVYLGAPDIEDSVPRACFIDKREFARYDDLRDFLRSLSPRAIRDYKENARAYLSSPAFQPFTTRVFIERFARFVREDTNLSLS